ncbi:MAG TPA: hypothetical protein VNW29_04045 [Candidatus Sulfotelmatobacter sp.]|jgi:hypothetical protein|nr:hypothetical protein [Candidatus Sulfotelmatobacter sp.]
MRKKKEYPRKRKRFIKQIILLFIVLLIFVIVISSIAYYLFAIKFKKPLYVSPLPIEMHYTQVDPGVKLVELLKKGLKKDQIEYTAISRENGSFIVTLQNGEKVTFSSQKDIMSQIASLQYILSHLTMEGRQFSSLDLRFDKPVIMIKG